MLENTEHTRGLEATDTGMTGSPEFLCVTTTSGKYGYSDIFGTHVPDQIIQFVYGALMQDIQRVLREEEPIRPLEAYLHFIELFAQGKTEGMSPEEMANSRFFVHFKQDA